MADFMKRKISTDAYQFPAGAFKIYGGGKFYNGFAIGATTKMSVVNEDGLLKFSREAARAQEITRVILGTLPPNSNTSIYVDVASPLPSSAALISVREDMCVYIDGIYQSIYMDRWSAAKIYQTTGDDDTDTIRTGGPLVIDFQAWEELPAIPNLCSIRAIWAL